jgi:plasmid stability protein
MPVMLQVRNLPDDVHAKLKQRAAAERMSLSDYVAHELAKLVAYRSNSEIIEEFHRNHSGLNITRDQVVEGIHAERAERDRNMDRVIAERRSTASNA